MGNALLCCESERAGPKTKFKPAREGKTKFAELDETEEINESQSLMGMERVTFKERDRPSMRDSDSEDEEEAKRNLGRSNKKSQLRSESKKFEKMLEDIQNNDEPILMSDLRSLAVSRAGSRNASPKGVIDSEKSFRKAHTRQNSLTLPLAEILANHDEPEESEPESDMTMVQPPLSSRAQDEKLAQLEEQLTNSGQGHLLQFLEQLNEQEKTLLLSQLALINPEATNNLYDQQMENTGGDDESDFDAAPQLRPVPGDLILVAHGTDENIITFQRRGQEMIRKGEIILAIFAADLENTIDDKEQQDTYKKLIELFVNIQNQALGSNNKKDHKVQILIITDAEDFSDTKQFFRNNKYFGANKQNLTFCKQGMVPTVDMDGKIIMKSTSQIQMLGNGSGALFELINENAKVREQLNQSKYVEVYNMAKGDNQILDPLLIGMTAEQNLEACIKCTKKNPKINDSVFVFNQNKIDMMNYEDVQNDNYHYDVVNNNDYVFECQRLLQLCEQNEDLNNLYTKTYSKIDTYDEEEMCTVSPEYKNGYVFQLNISAYFQHCNEGKVKIIIN